MKLKFLCLLICLYTNFSFSDTSIQREPAKENCDIKNKICSYITQNINARELISRMLPALFPDQDLDPSEGFVRQETFKKINFWFENNDLRERFISLLSRFDTLEDFVPTHLVQLTTEIYSVTEDALTNLQASLNFSNIQGSGPDSQAGLQASFSIGNWALSAAIAAQRVNRQMELVTTIRQMVPNLSNINYSHITNIFINTSSVETKVEEAGIKINGQVSINRYDRSQMVVKDYSFYYGVEQISPTGLSRVSKLSIKPPELYLSDGLSTVIVSSNTFATSRDASIGLPTDIQNGRHSSKLFIVTRAKSVTYQEFLDENRALRNMQIHRKFTPEEINDFPSDKIELEEIVEYLDTNAKFLLNGDRILSFKFDKSLARRDNYKQNLKIKISTQGFKQVEVRSIENLMLSGLKLNDLPNNLLQKSLLKLKLKFKDFKKKGFYQHTKTVYYNPETNEFIE